MIGRMHCLYPWREIGDLNLMGSAEAVQGIRLSWMSLTSRSPDGIRGSLECAEVGEEHGVGKILGGET